MAYANSTKLYIVVIIIMIVKKRQEGKNILICKFSALSIKNDLYLLGLCN